MDNAVPNDKAIMVAIKEEITRQLSDPETLKSLLDTTFKGIKEPSVAKRAMLEGMLRGFSFKDFLEKNVYAVPFGDSYSLVTSIDYARKIGAKSGIVGVDEPKYTYSDDGTRLLSCSVTLKKRFSDGYIGEFVGERDFSEYTTGKGLWISKPKTMISKVAEMLALRKACPEELSQSYVEEEFEKGDRVIHEVQAVDVTGLSEKMDACSTIPALNLVWADMPGDAKVALKEKYAQIKSFIEDANKGDVN